MKANKFWIDFGWIKNTYLDRAVHINMWVAPVTSLEVELWWVYLSVGVDWRHLLK